MSGLAEILDENARLRRKRDEIEARFLSMTAALSDKDAIIVEKDATIVERDVTIAEQVATIALREAMVEAVQGTAEALAEQLAFLRRKVSGPASQRYITEEQALLPFVTDVALPPRRPEPEAKPKPKKTRNRPRRRSRQSLAHLKSRTIRCKAIVDSCRNCGGTVNVIGQATSFRVDWVPGYFVVDDVVRDKCACPSCPSEGVLTVPAPYALDRSLCANGLLARIIVDKFSDHIPLNRQAKRMGREGLAVGSNTLAAWTKAGGSLLGCIALSIRDELLTQAYLQGDDTGFPVQDGGDGKLRKCRMWAFTDQMQVFYAFTESKEGKFPAELLANFAGELLLVDGGSEFNQVVREQDLKRAGCWSHLRTYFFNAKEGNPGEVAIALGTIRDLFLIERTLWGKPPDEVLAGRQQFSMPLIDGFFAWVRAVAPLIRPGSLLGKAVTYATNQEAAMRLHLEHGELPMHNNLSELMLRQTVVGRKNWLFARSEGGAEVAATCYTLIGSCMLQGIDPLAYLVDVLGRVQDHPSTRLHELTPREWRLEREHHASTSA